MKQTVKKLFPFVTVFGDLYRLMCRTIRRIVLLFIPRKKIFAWYFTTNKWGDDESYSGAGSNMEATKTLRDQLPAFFNSQDIKSIVDVPCGDFNWMQELDLGDIDYIGVDIVDELIMLNTEKYGAPKRKFAKADMCKDQLPKADLIFCRDALVHLSNKDVFSAIETFKKSGASYLMTTIYPEIDNNKNISTGMWRALNLCLEPFNFPAPRGVFNEKAEGHESRYGDKCMYLWNIGDLP